MSDSGLKLPTSTELEGRVRLALQFAKAGISLTSGEPLYADAVRALGYRRTLEKVIFILEDGRS